MVISTSHALATQGLSSLICLPSLGVLPVRAPACLHSVFPMAVKVGGCSPPVMWEM